MAEFNVGDRVRVIHPASQADWWIAGRVAEHHPPDHAAVHVTHVNLARFPNTSFREGDQPSCLVRYLEHID
ncbi:hypothetical protein SAMN04488548_1342947 [Gordonia westfalica]|uniref:Uncharacterized protein n=1 Tax=Gordonia westfalica TaxID=158898 RepID=A0A1H2K836_9ACTN|nr:hypothetical protein SAMN04488548_1342947 [Gordonia westfalica]